jgi:hypothetical protein
VTKRLSSAQCGNPVTQENDIAPLTFIFALTSFVVMVRLAVKFLGHGGGWGIDDWLMLISFVSYTYSIHHHHTCR